MGSSCGKCNHHPVRDKIKEVVGKIFGTSKSETSSSIGYQDSYDPEKARLEETIRVQQCLTNFRTRSERECDALELDVLKATRSELDDMIRFLKSINEKKYSGQKLGLNIDKILRDNRKTEDIIRGYIKKNIQKRVSLDDSECLTILKMSEGSEKEKAMTKFLDGVLKESLEGLSKAISDSVNKQINNVEEKIMDRIDNCETISEEKLLKFKEIEMVKTSNEGDLENKIANLCYKESLSSIGLTILE